VQRPFSRDYGKKALGRILQLIEWRRRRSQPWESRNIKDREMDSPWPTELRLNSEKNLLRVSFTGGESAELSAELLRVMSPSAEVQGHSPSERKLISGKRAVIITKVEPVGNYAVRLTFSDGHNTGIFSWAYLYEMARDKDRRWDAYLADLDAAGLCREPR
jgi:DUF971 family protein